MRRDQFHCAFVNMDHPAASTEGGIVPPAVPTFIVGPPSAAVRSTTVPTEPPATVPDETALENKLIQVRLGVASGLFAALRAKHPPSAAHSLRVALGCSSWALAMNLDENLRDELEVGALLHDVGKIGIPDSILQKPESLTGKERTIVTRERQQGLLILEACCAAPRILDIVRYAAAWFDGSLRGFDRQGANLPVAARMVAIVDAFDAMTNDHVYRRAVSRERAMAELFAHSGTQFDPHLVREFCALHSTDQGKLHANVIRRWLKQLNPNVSNGLWQLQQASEEDQEGPGVDALFHEMLLRNMHDGVVFVDNQLRIVDWNQGLERLTGVAAASVLHQKWLPELLALCDERGSFVAEENCPVAAALATGAQSVQRVSVKGRDGLHLPVDAHVMPIVGRKGTIYGAALLLHDATAEISLELRVKKLHERATRDPLTKVANRAEFDRVHNEFIETHLASSRPCALIMCDIDHFKRINDNFGHQAGDEALVHFAALLQRLCRPGDLVARYGGEEFIMLCADCDNPTATERAEEIRLKLSQIPQPMLNDSYMTASFGVTELQDGDTPETMTRRSDRALYQAKESGRNCVVQLGGGMNGATPARREANSGWLSWLFGETPDLLVEQTLVTFVPLYIATEKLRGYVADQGAEVESVDQGHVVLRLEGDNLPNTRRTDDRAVPFLVELTLTERRDADPSRTDGQGRLSTQILVAIRPLRNRDRRRGDAIERARQLLFSLKSYLMAQEIEGGGSTAKPESTAAPGIVDQAKSLLGPWLGG